MTPSYLAPAILVVASNLPFLCSSSFIIGKSLPPTYIQSAKLELRRRTHGAASRSLASLTPSDADENVFGTCDRSCQNRRSFVAGTIATTFGILTDLGSSPNVAVAADGSLGQVLGQIKEASDQLDAVPDLIKAEKWDSVRAILIKPPLSDLWTSGGSKKLLNVYAEAIGNELPNGDEISALELREELISHLRYLDMAVYNNVFNPIATEGKTGATKELIRSYYEDPIMEWKASKSVMEDLIRLASP